MSQEEPRQESFEHLAETGVSFYREPRRTWFVSQQDCEGGVPYGDQRKKVTRTSVVLLHKVIQVQQRPLALQVSPGHRVISCETKLVRERNVTLIKTRQMLPWKTHEHHISLSQWAWLPLLYNLTVATGSHPVPSVEHDRLV